MHCYFKVKRMAIQKYKGHLALLGAAIMWGLMSPIGKTALENGISGLSLATFRMTGGAICFWIRKNRF